MQDKDDTGAPQRALCIQLKNQALAMFGLGQAGEASGKSSVSLLKDCLVMGCYSGPAGGTKGNWLFMAIATDSSRGQMPAGLRALSGHPSLEHSQLPCEESAIDPVFFRGGN